MYTIVFTKNAIKDIQNLKSAHLDSKTKSLIEIIKNNLFQNPPTYEKLAGKYKGLCLRRINYQYRLVYEVLESEKN